MALVRFVQEAMANVHRHSGSKTVAVEIQLQDGMIRTSVADTGRGIPTKTLRELHASDGHVGGVGYRNEKRIGQLGVAWKSRVTHGHYVVPLSQGLLTTLWMEHRRKKPCLSFVSGARSDDA